MRVSIFTLLATLLCHVAPASDQTVEKINELLSNHHEKHGTSITPISDEQFLRRVYLDLAGRIPTISESDAFLRSESADRREKLVEELLQSEAYVSHFYNWWADILRMDLGLAGASQHRTVAASYRLWLKGALRTSMPYDQFVTALLSASGHHWENGAVAYYYRDAAMPLDNLANSTRIFLATRLECAQCHDHPFEDWTQQDFYQLAALTKVVDTKERAHPRAASQERRHLKSDHRAYKQAVKHASFPIFFSEKQVEDYLEGGRHGNVAEPYPPFSHYQKSLGLDKRKFTELATKGINAIQKQRERNFIERRAQRRSLLPGYRNLTAKNFHLRYPHDYQYDHAEPYELVEPQTPFGDTVSLDIDFSPSDGPREFAKWVTSPTNPQFARTIANRIWAKLFGQGLIIEIDDFAIDRGGSVPGLLEFLGETVVALDYDLKEFTQLVVATDSYQSQAYAKSVPMGESYPFTGPLLRRLSAEQIWDSLATAALGDLDYYMPSLTQDLAYVEADMQKYRSLDLYDAQSYQKMIDDVADILEEEDAVTNYLTSQLAVARKHGSPDRVANLEKEGRRAEVHFQNRIEERAFSLLKPGARLGELYETFKLQDIRERIYKTHQWPSRQYPSSKLAEEERKKRMRESLADRESWAGKLKIVARASETYRRGDYQDLRRMLGNLGQSDRLSIESASKQPGIPQGLDLLNGFWAETIPHRLSQVFIEARKLETPEQKFAKLYQGLLVRSPSDQELEALLELEREMGPKSYYAAARALLSGTEILFQQ